MFYDNFLDAIDQLPEEERANACYQLCKYALNDELPKDKSLAMFCIGVRFSVHKYQGRGGNHNPAGHNQYSGQSGQTGQTGQNGQKAIQTQTETETEIETKRESIERKGLTTTEVNKCSQTERKNQVRGSFIPPTLEEVLEYAKQMHETRNINGFYCSRDTATRFYLQYESQNWMLGNGNHMSNWKVGLKKWAFDELKKQKES